jgi:hypothetical protein
MRNQMRKNGGALAAVVVLTIAAAACGSASKSTTAAKKPAATTSTTAASSTTSAATTPTSPAPTNTVWLCKPGLANNPCEGDFTTSVVAADGKTTTQKAAPAKNPPIDCFYVYPTVSTQKTPIANLDIDPAETGVAQAQAARFSQVCKVYAPMYRQLTLQAISNRGGVTAADAATAYGDVQNAWLDYLAHYNHGRGVVLIGHSQGASQLEALIRQQVDNKPAVRKQLVSAILLGGNVQVPIGKDVGGTFMNVPACTKSSQTSCVVAYSSFLDTPPANSLFGRARMPGNEVLCTNPAALAGGSATLVPEFPAGGQGQVASIVPGQPSSGSPWVSYSDLYTGVCQNSGGANVLHITPTPGPDDKRPVVTQQLGPTWGLHLVDVNIDLGNLIDLVKSESAAYQG